MQEYERPTRLLAFDEAVAKLVLTETFGEMPYYATLSYCWGRDPFTMLTVETMNSFLKGFAIRSLPKVFQDAIRVAQELGMSYIWIDALCIIQQGDCNKDWLTESGRMKSVYGNSFVNIAASSATNVYDNSLLSKGDHYSGGFCARVTMSKYCTVRKFHMAAQHRESTMWTHLGTRAWTFQERLLPARTIFLGDRGIFWECRTGTRSEAFPEESSDIFALRLVRPENQGWAWDAIVKEYSGTDLTNPSDRLPALAGIARRQHEATGNHYLAGMWKEQLLPQLAWFVSGEPRKRPAWRAPSWSWVAVDGSVQEWVGMQKDSREYISVIDAWTMPSGPDAFSQVSSGLLRIRCSALVRAELLSLDRSQGTSGPQRSKGIRLVALEAAKLHFPVSLDALEDERDCDEVYLLPLLSGSCGRRYYLEKVNKEEEGEDTFLTNSEKHWQWGVEAVEKQLSLTGIGLRQCGKDVDNEGRFVRAGSFKFENFSIDQDDQLGADHYNAFIRILDSERPEETKDESSGNPSSQDPVENWMDITIE